MSKIQNLIGTKVTFADLATRLFTSSLSPESFMLVSLHGCFLAVQAQNQTRNLGLMLPRRPCRSQLFQLTHSDNNKKLILSRLCSNCQLMKDKDLMSPSVYRFQVFLMYFFGIFEGWCEDLCFDGLMLTLKTMRIFSPLN